MTMRDHPTPASLDAPLGVAGRLAHAFQANAITPLLALVALLLGLFAVLVTPREEEPQINVTMANVLIPFPGASVADVEALVAAPAEQVLAQIAGIEHTFAVSRPGLAVLTVQFKVGVPRTEALVRLHDVLAANKDWLPTGLGVGEPIVKPQGIDDVPVLALTLWGRDAPSAHELERVARTLENELKRVSGTREVKLIGAPGRALQVWLDPSALRARGLPIDQLQRAIAGASVALPAGQVLEASGTSPPGRAQMLVVETGEHLQSADDVGQIVVGVQAGKPIYLHEVARIEDGPQLTQRHVWFTPGVASAASNPGGAYPAITLSVTKKPGENAVAVSRALRERIAQLRNTVIPQGIEATLTRDYGETAGDKANKLIQKLSFATGSVILLVGLALGRREAVTVGSAVILTLAATLFASWAWGFTLNRVSLFALIFSIGILVDDAIVVVENIHRHRQMAADVSAQAHVDEVDVKGAQAPGRSQNIHRHRTLTPELPLLTLIPRAVDEVGGPTILATLTVIAALLPMAFVSGLMGPYMSPIPINASLGMALSLVIAFTVTPWLAYRFYRRAPLPVQAGGPGGHGPQGWLHRLFTRLLAPLLAQRRRRAWLAVGVGVLMVLSVSLVGLQWVVLKMLPFDNKSEFQVVLDMPAGTPLEDTAAALQAMSEHLARQPEVLDVQGYAGTASPITFNGLVRQYALRTEGEMGDLQVKLVDHTRRSAQSHAIAQRLRPGLERIAALHGARIKVVEVPPGPPVMAPLVAEVYGPDAAGRDALARQLAGHFARTPDIVGIDTSLKEAAPRAFLRIERARAEQLGVPVAAIAQTVQGALSGVDAAWLHDGHSSRAVPIRLQLPREMQTGLDELLALPLKTADGRMVALSELVRVERGVIDPPRHRKDLLPVSYVVGDMAGALDSPLYGLMHIRQTIAGGAGAGAGAAPAPTEHWVAAPQDPWRAYAIKWDGEWQITYETFRDMGAAYAVGLVLIYLLAVAQFRSYLTPLIIMAPIPLTIVGVMPGHALLQAQFTATSMIGMIALAGIIVRNSILLVDFIELETARGVPFAQAVVQSAAVRAQPIALTGLAAMVGAFFILDDPIFNGLAVSLIFGILVSTLLTLVLIPVLYYAVFRRRHEPALALTPAATEGETP
jgi:multidrug efflux pump subunit AcrB